eukprot:TRINITY_DN19059_c0_g1_i1.p1 TRINITY_DN19059_c0_g1~~TRINITY_DN19059_c0_g1_i1.p1  ORF type:complete len:432 (+),score=89.38 TRINITY_DN19059_c0_g1_i1:25-1320(+)
MAASPSMEVQAPKELDLGLGESQDSDSPPTADELRLLGQLREMFAEDLSLREAKGLNTPCIFGDFALTRVLRGCMGDLDKAATWLRRLFDNMEQFELDGLIDSMCKKLDEHPELPLGHACMLPNYDELKTYLNEIYHFPKLASSGDPINYFAFCDVDSQGILDNIEWDHFVQYHRAATVLRMIVLDRLSREQNRMVKTIWIGDLKGSSIRTFHNPEFQKHFDKDIAAFQQTVAAEVLRKIYALNGPWWAVQLWQMFQRLIPEGMKRKIQLLEGGGMEDPAFTSLLGGRATLQQMLLSRKGLVGGEVEAPSGEVEVARRSVFEYCVDASEHQHISWRFYLVGGMSDALLGEPDIKFSVEALWFVDGEEGDAAEARQSGLDKEELVPEEVISISMGTAQGSCKIPRRGIVSLRWSNLHSVVRAKTLNYAVEVS